MLDKEFSYLTHLRDYKEKDMKSVSTPVTNSGLWATFRLEFTPDPNPGLKTIKEG